MLKEPYFMKNKDWYTYDADKEQYVLTENAPVEAVESYKKFLKDLKDYNAMTFNKDGKKFKLYEDGTIEEDLEDDDEEAASLFGF